MRGARRSSSNSAHRSSSSSRTSGGGGGGGGGASGAGQRSPMLLFKTTAMVLALLLLNYVLLSQTSQPIAPEASTVAPTGSDTIPRQATHSMPLDPREEKHQTLADAILAHATCLSSFPLRPACGHPAELADAQRNASSFYLSPSAQLAVRKLDALLEIKQRSFQCQGDDTLGLYPSASAPGASPKQDLGYVKAVVRSVKVASKKAAHGAAKKRQPLYVAALLHDNAKVFPFWAREVLKLILSHASPLEAGQKGSRFGHIFVAIYESGSVDNTPRLLRHFDTILRDLGVPRWVRATGDLGGHEGYDEVYEMLAPAVAGVGTTGSALGNDDIPFGASPDEMRKKAWKDDRIGHLAVLRNVVLGPMLLGAASFDHVSYLNDVFFCASGAKELMAQSLQHSADLVCSTDYTEKDPVCNNCSDLQFYDIWVAHDRSGVRFANEPPFIRGHAPSLGQLARLEPFPVFSCWNGMVVIKADLFQTEGLRFRTHAPFECGASECELFNRDMWTIGRHRIIMVPSVITAYVFRTFVAVNNRRTFHPLKQWEDIEGSGLMDFSFGPPPAVTCCNLATGATIIDWWNDCFPETDWQKIHTTLGSPPRAAVELGLLGIPNTRAAVIGSTDSPSNHRHLQQGAIASALVPKTGGGALDHIRTVGDLRSAVRRVRCGDQAASMSSEKLQPAAELDNYHQQLSGVGFRQIKELAISYFEAPLSCGGSGSTAGSGR